MCAQTAEDNRGTNIVVLDMARANVDVHYFRSGQRTSDAQLHAMSEEIDHALGMTSWVTAAGNRRYEESRWILLDYGDVVVHLFEPELRAYYALKTWWVPCQTGAAEPQMSILPDLKERFRGALAGSGRRTRPISWN